MKYLKYFENTNELIPEYVYTIGENSRYHHCYIGYNNNETQYPFVFLRLYHTEDEFKNYYKYNSLEEYKDPSRTALSLNLKITDYVIPNNSFMRVLKSIDYDLETIKFEDSSRFGYANINSKNMLIDFREKFIKTLSENSEKIKEEIEDYEMQRNAEKYNL